MSEVTRTRTMAATPAAIWDALADFGAISGWAANVDHSCLLHRGPGGGAQGTTRRIQMGRNTIVERIVTWEEGRSLAYDIEGLPPVLRTARNRWDLHPVAPDATHVTLTSTIDAGPRPPQQLIARIAGRVFAKQSDVMLEGLARHLEVSRV